MTEKNPAISAGFLDGAGLFAVIERVGVFSVLF
jgi:hypothetical protein